jgi:putative flippase GtrA
VNIVNRLKLVKKKEILRFLVCGTTAVLIDFSLYHLLMHCGLSVAVSKWVSFIAGAVFGYVANKLWTFESRQNVAAELPKFIILYAVTAFINTGVNSAVIWLTSWSFFAFLCATGVSTILNFAGMKFIVFKTRRA